MVEEAKNGGLEAAYYYLVVFVEVGRCHLHLSMVVQPVNLSVLELALVVVGELVSDHD